MGGVLLKDSIELEGNNVDEDYEFPGYNTAMGWSNGKLSWGEITPIYICILMRFRSTRRYFPVA